MCIKGRALPWAIPFCLFEAFLGFLKTSIRVNYKYCPHFLGQPVQIAHFPQKE